MCIRDRVGTYHIEVSCTGYDSGTIDGIVVSNGDVTGRDLTLHKTVTFIPVTDITMTNAATVEVNTDLALTGTVTPDNATNRTMVWTVADADGTGAVINGSTFRAAAAGTATVKEMCIRDRRNVGIGRPNRGTRVNMSTRQTAIRTS